MSKPDEREGWERIEITYDIDLEDPKRAIFIIESNVPMSDTEMHRALEYLTNDVIGKQLRLIHEADESVSN
jgi:hypothetical protein